MCRNLGLDPEGIGTNMYSHGSGGFRSDKGGFHMGDVE